MGRIAFPDADIQWHRDSFFPRLPLRGQCRTWTGFPFHPAKGTQRRGYCIGKHPLCNYNDQNLSISSEAI